MNVAIFTSSNCGGGGAIPLSQFAASLVVLFHLKSTFPEWDAMLVSDDSRWKSAECREALSKFQDHFRSVFGDELRFVPVRVGDVEVLDRIAHSTGKETDHSRGHWPVEAYAHLAASLEFSKLGYHSAVYVDPDVFFLDDSLKYEIGKVKDVGCISAIPAERLRTAPTSRASNRSFRDMRDEYRLITNETLLSRVIQKAATKYDSSYTIKNSTNSGVVVYNTSGLEEKRWNDWLLDLFLVSPKGFYGDQTVLSVAYGRDDIDVHWLHPKFNVGLTFPKEIVRLTCGRDVTYAKNAAAFVHENVSAVHFIWGPKPWTTQMNDRRRSTTRISRGFAVQADLPYANKYREAARSLVSTDLLHRYFKPKAFDPINKTFVSLHHGAFSYCERSDHNNPAATTH